MNATAAGERVELRAILPAPPGVNASYRSARDIWYKSARARAWEDEALLLLRASGFRIKPLGSYWLGVDLTLWTCRLDADAPLKIVLDALEAALGINDRCVGHLCVSKRLVSW